MPNEKKSAPAAPIEFDLTVAKSHDGLDVGHLVHVVGAADPRTNALWAAGYFTAPEGFEPAPVEEVADGTGVPAPEAQPGEAPGDAVRG